MSFEGRRRVTNPQTLRALSHPLRLQLLDLLEQSGPLTATEAAAHLDTTPSNCSFHLRLLARHGYVEEAPGGVGRQRPWRAVDQVNEIRADDLDAEGRLALRGVLEVLAERYRSTALRWLRTREQFPAEWREAAGETHTVLHLTADELAGVSKALRDAVAPFEDRRARGRPGTAPVVVTLSALPARLPHPPSSEENHADVP